MYSKLPHLVIGFHGCDQSVYDAIVYDKDSLRPSQNDYDWLGHGIYFWENNEERAWDFASELKRKKLIAKEAVIGAVIDLGRCLNLTDTQSIQIVKNGYNILCDQCQTLGIELPHNKPGGSKTDLLLRNLDCAVLESVHRYNELKNLEAFDSVRGVFTEGKRIYPNAGFHEKTHIQICIRNPNCIKGYFVPRDQDSAYDLP